MSSPFISEVGGRGVGPRGRGRGKGRGRGRKVRFLVGVGVGSQGVGGRLLGTRAGIAVAWWASGFCQPRVLKGRRLTRIFVLPSRVISSFHITALKVGLEMDRS